MAVVDDLQEHHVYKFSVFMANAAGRGEMSMAVIQALPGAGLYLSLVIIILTMTWYHCSKQNCFVN